MVISEFSMYLLVGQTLVVMNTSHRLSGNEDVSGGKSSHPPGDIASGVDQSPVQPRVRFPARSFGKGRARASGSINSLG